MSVEPKQTTYVVEDLLGWHEQGTLVLSPKFQRRLVWSPAARSYFIDTLLRGFPVPPIHIRMIRDSRRGLVREVVDGQQRLRSVLDFVAGKHRLSRTLEADWAGRTYDTLDEDERQAIRDYSFHVYQYSGVTDETILNIFARMNTYSVALNAQELRNGRYFGQFKRNAYSLALEYLTFWRDTGIFSESAIARMQEAQLVSELLIMQMDGLQDKKATVDDFYKNLDVDWRDPQTWVSRKIMRPSQWLSAEDATIRFRSTMSALVEAVGDSLPESEFRRAPLFYSLYGAVYHRLYGLPRFEQATPKKKLTKANYLGLREATAELSDLLSEKPKVDDLRGWRREFVIASARQTDNVSPRQKRVQTIWDRAELS